MVLKETVYIVLEKAAKLSGDKDLKKLNVKLMDVCDVCCSNKDMENKINHLEVTVLDVDGQKHVRKLVSLTDLINIIEAQVDNVDISPVGENQVMLDYERKKSNNKLIGIKIFLLILDSNLLSTISIEISKLFKPFSISIIYKLFSPLSNIISPFNEIHGFLLLTILANLSCSHILPE